MRTLNRTAALANRSTLFRFARKLSLGFVATALASSAAAATAQAMPKKGGLKGVQKMQGLTYQCRKLKDGKLRCSFRYVSVIPIKKESSRARERAKVVGEYESGRTEQRMKQDCPTFEKRLAILEGTVPAPADSPFHSLGKARIPVEIERVKNLIKFCKAPSLDAYLTIWQADFERKKHTCRVSSRSFARTFQAAGDGSLRWLGRTSPLGQCSVEYVSRFEPELNAKGRVRNWQFFTKRVVNNPEEEWLPGLSCKRLDQTEYRFHWRKRTWTPKCDHVVFYP